MHKKSAEEKYQYTDHHDKSEDISCGNDKVIHRPQEGEYSFGTGKAINNHFNTAKKDDTEAPENKSMSQANDWTAENFRLPDSYLKHEPYSFTPVFDGKRFGEPEEGHISPCCI